MWNRNHRNRNFLTSGTGTVTCKKDGAGTVIDYGSGTGTRYKIMYFDYHSFNISLTHIIQ
jgi:hypothetical protein